MRIKKMNHAHRQGVTLVEMMVVMGVVAILFTLGTVSILGVQRNASVNSSLEKLTTDVREQQSKTMLGDGEKQVIASASGIYFTQNNYVLFRGNSYNSTDPSNYVVNLDPGWSFDTINFPNSTIIFSRGSGEISGFTIGQDNVVLKNSGNNETRTVTFNRYGAIVSIN